MVFELLIKSSSSLSFLSFIFLIFVFFVLCLLEPDIGLGVEVDDKVFAISHSQPSLCESNFNYC